MSSSDVIKRNRRRPNFEPEALHVPALPPAQERARREAPEEKPVGSHVVVIDIS